MNKTAEERKAEHAEMLRVHRVRNYRIKRKAGWKCSECSADNGIVVVRTGTGEGDENFKTRCKLHIGDLTPTPGQEVGMGEEG